MADTELTDEDRGVLDTADDARDLNLSLLRELVEAKPVNPPVHAPRGRPNIVARLEGDVDGPTLLMNATSTWSRSRTSRPGRVTPSR